MQRAAGDAPPKRGRTPGRQQKTKGQAGGSDSGSGLVATSAGSTVQYPPNPKPFFRGNFPLDDTGSGTAGWYLSLLCFIPVLLMLMLWAWSTNWVDSDSRSLKVRTEYWNSIIVACGFIGFWAVFFVPQFLIGFAVLLMAYGVPLGLYVQERNGRVPDASKVLTPDHIRKVVIRALARVGIRIGSEESLEAAIGPPIQFIGKSVTGRDLDESRTRQVESSRGFLAARELIYDAVLRRSTDVHLEPKDDELAVRLRIDGVMYPAEPFDRAIGDAIVNVFKVLSALDITERRRPQDGSFRAVLEDRQIDFRVATQGTRHGEKMSLRILDQANSVSKMSGLGLRKQLQEKLRGCIHQPHGLLLCCGPTGAGKSTTLYAALGDLDAYQQNIITVEDPVEYKMDNVNQIEINTKSGQSFANSLRSILRQDPDVVMIGEIRDEETANIACQAANTGHMVFSTVHANDTITALYRMLELGVEPFMIANSISAILAQRLVRRLCPDCRRAYRPKPELLKKHGLPLGKIEKFYRAPKNSEQVCPTCGGLGHRGRIGVFELLIINDRIRDLIREKAAMSTIRSEARKRGMLYMKEEGMRLVARGVTSLDELLRVVK